MVRSALVERVSPGAALRQFQWFATGPVPAGCDLRRLGWKLLGEHDALPQGEFLPLLAMPERLLVSEWVTLSGAELSRRRRALVVGIDDALERARLLRLGFGDAMGPQPELEELEIRALRIGEAMQSLPRYRQIGSLRLDLLQRDGLVAGRPLGLHPREFGLLWRLADSPGEPVMVGSLLRDVWRLAFRPETNSLAVHISRLRAKLRVSGLDGLIETLPDGCYRLSTGMIGAVQGAGPAAAYLPLDAAAALGKVQPRYSTTT